MSAERDKWKSTCVSTSHGLEDVLEERDMLKVQLEAALDTGDAQENEIRELKVHFIQALTPSQSRAAENVGKCGSAPGPLQESEEQ